MVLSLKLSSQNYVKSELVDKIDKCLISYGTLVLVVIWLSYVLQQKKMVTIVNGLYSINNNFKSCDKFTLKSDCRFYILSIINFCLCFGIIVIECFISGAYTAILWIVPFITSSWVLIQYTLLLNVISQFFESINAKILQLADINTENYYQTALRSKVSLGDLAIKDINCISNAIMQLCDICDQVADFYAISILLIIVYFVTSTTFNSYFLILSLIISTNNDLLKLFLDFGNWFLIVSFDLISLTSNVTRITREFKKTPQYVSLLLNRCAMNSPTRESLLDFLLDLSYRNVNFNAYGVIALNGSLLQTIYGTIVTYLIILIQFRNQQ
ncbi:GSCOCT00013870001.3-RA-CDS [Cotesia congregata]|uniref:Gustatory receptor n=1 Tax=Cotesia congregata TaxID=51543 RepID=A0A8J2H7B4_COTCN|nr:GSCOCT00013870001.3-RA-CDS [Cotesia congregata]CAG5080883.1 gustatory receptor 8.4 [Cotesia congregata]